MTQTNVVISTNRPGLAFGVASALEARGLAVSFARGARSDDFKITYRPGVGLTRVAEVVSALGSTEPDTVREEAGQEPDIVLHWPINCRKNETMRQTAVDIVSDSPELGGKLADFFRSVGFAEVNHFVGPTTANTLALTAETPTAIGGLIRLKMRELGCNPGSVEVSRSRPRPSGGRIRVEVRDRALVDLPAVERFPVKVRADSLDDGQELVDILAGHGFRVEIGAPIEATKADESMLAIKPGVMGGAAGAPTRGVLFHVVKEFLRGKGVDLGRYPLFLPETSGNPGNTETGASAEAVVTLPVKACRAGTARSRGGAYPDRFDIHIRTDCPEHSMVASLRERLVASGFTNIHVECTSDGETRRNPLALVMGSAFQHPVVIDKLRDIVTECASTMVEAGFTPRAENRFTPDDNDIYINLPLLGWEDGSLMAEMASASGFDMKIHCEEPSEWEDVIETLRSMGFDDFDIESGTVARAEMKFGGAPARLLERVAKVINDCSGLVPARSKAWPDPDDDIYVFLPRRPARARPETACRDEEEPEAFGDLGQDHDDWRAPVEAEGPFVQIEAGRVNIGGLELARRTGPRDPLAPCPGRFTHFCLDEKTASTLRHVAVSVLMNEPCLLEGETSTSKTSTIEYLAALLGQPIVRINLNGQTDTGELLGRFVPNEHAGDGKPAAGWRWQDGLVVQALRNGWWLLLDEVNLAETQILERLNSLLEAHPSLVLTEHGNEIFGGNGTPIHPSFRIFGTMNPAEYAGRSVMSPAYKDRWRGLRQVPTPGELDYRSMLRLMVLGQQPSLVIDEVAYPGAQCEPSHPGLDSLDGIEEELDALAKFHATAGSAAAEGSGQLAARRKERPVFTRRSLLSVLDYVCRVERPAPGTAAGPLLRKAAQRYYSARMADAADLGVLTRLLEASGLGQEVRA